MLTDIVQTFEPYTYAHLVEDVIELQNKYPFIEIEIIGQSIMGKNMYAFRLGRGNREIFYSGDWHANEYLTGHLLMKFIEDYMIALTYNLPLFGYDVSQLYNNYSIWIVPMVNPDGIELVLEGLNTKHPYYEEILRINTGSMDFRNWTANIRGVDLNHQWPADWEEEVERSPKVPSPKRYGGIAPLTEPESQAIYQFVKQHNFGMVLAYHSQGEEIFWGFKGFEPPESKHIVEHFEQLTGYTPKQSASSSAGFKDWFIQEYRKPGFTIEIGLGENPLPIEQFPIIYWQNAPMLIEAPFFMR